MTNANARFCSRCAEFDDCSVDCRSSWRASLENCAGVFNGMYCSTAAIDDIIMSLVDEIVSMRRLLSSPNVCASSLQARMATRNADAPLVDRARYGNRDDGRSTNVDDFCFSIARCSFDSCGVCGGPQ